MDRIKQLAYFFCYYNHTYGKSIRIRKEGIEYLFIGSITNDYWLLDLVSGEFDWITFG